MTHSRGSLLVLVVALASVSTTAARAVSTDHGVVLLTQDAALSGGITANDTPGFPITLSEPGSYRLGSNLHPPAGTVGVVITNADVTIDFAGFKLYSDGTATYGIQATSTKARGATIRNGTISNFKNDGIKAPGEFWIVENMRIVLNGNDGINIGDNFRAYGNIISQNKHYGLYCGAYCHVESNTISQSGNIGLYILSGMALGNTLVKNTSYGMYMFYGAFGNNTLIQNNNDQAGDQVLGAYYNLQPNFCNPACP